MDPALIPKKIRLDLSEKNALDTCKHYVKRKKRFCKMVVAKGKIYCGEHEPINESEKSDFEDCRIVCPLDPKHTVYKKNLAKHLKICNAKEKEYLPLYIKPGVNDGSSDTESGEISHKNSRQVLNKIKLSDVSENSLLLLINKIEKIYQTFVDGKIQQKIFEHSILFNELNKAEYGKVTTKHLSQTASLLGYLEKSGFLKNDTSFIEFGAGKGQVSYWLAKIIEDQVEHLNKTNMILIDRASLRHKKDNKLENRSTIHRIRADIQDIVLQKLDPIKEMKHIVAVGKHLCGSATDLMLRCLLHHNTEQHVYFVVSLCCHHRCIWKSFVGKDFLKCNGINDDQFILMTKMVSWAVCGNGMSRQKRNAIEKEEKTIEENYLHISKEKKKEIGKMCKRILDYARLSHMESLGYECNLNFYATEETTLENVCLLGKKDKEKTNKNCVGKETDSEKNKKLIN